jgi:hypothetical protein
VSRRLRGEKRISGARESESRTIAPPVAASGVFTLEQDLSRLRGEHVFLRKFHPFSTKVDRHLRVIVAVLAVTLLAAGIVYLLQRGPRGAVELLLMVLREPSLLLLLVAVGAYLVSRRYERLTISREGIAYVSFLSGPLGFMNTLYPDWFVPWKNVAAIELKPGEQRASTWQFEIIVEGAPSRSLNPLAWRPAGAEASGVPLRAMLNPSAEVFRSAIEGSALYRLLRDYAPIRSQSPG